MCSSDLHNEVSQAVEGLEECEIMEIIDHHRIGSVETVSPVYFRNQPVGCTGTIVAQMYREQGIEITKPLAEVNKKTIEEGLLIIQAQGNVIRFVPPLIVEEKHIDEMIEKLKRALA